MDFLSDHLLAQSTFHLEVFVRMILSHMLHHFLGRFCLVSAPAAWERICWRFMLDRLVLRHISGGVEWTFRASLAHESGPCRCPTRRINVVLRGDIGVS